VSAITVPRAVLEQALEALGFSCPAPDLMDKHKAAEDSLRTALEQALEALENCTSEHGHRCSRCDSEVDEGGRVITALRAALAQQVVDPADEYRKGFIDGQIDMRDRPEEQEQEPVAWIQSNHLQQAQREPFLCRVEPTQRLSDFVPLYTHPPRRETEQEPVAWVDEASIAWLAEHPLGIITTRLVLQKSPERQMPLYTAPPRREWQSLTQEELDRWTPEIHSVIRAIEAKLKDKNS
jgi:hypothetical protein